jgi:hypothetical protein
VLHPLHLPMVDLPPSPRRVTRASGQNGDVSTLEDWTATVCAELGLEPGAVDVSAVLDMTRDVAHDVARPAAPLTAFLAGIAIGRGASATEVVTKVTSLAQSWPGESGR